MTLLLYIPRQTDILVGDSSNLLFVLETEKTSLLFSRQDHFALLEVPVCLFVLPVIDVVNPALSLNTGDK